MTAKQAILSELGEGDILAPDRIARSLVANDQVKYFLALLQTARGNADSPRVPVVDLKAERIASGIGEDWLDEVVAETRKDKGGAYRVPHGAELVERIHRLVGTMLDCLPDGSQADFRARLAALPTVTLKRDLVPGDVITGMASGDRSAGDSLHLIVMDAHRAINRLQSETAAETIAGAKVHNVTDWGRGRVAAFMRGLNRTAPLKFDHPGLGTTATEHGGRLLIQNDIGTTDAHVLVVRVEPAAVTVTYTDIHRQRLEFFKSLFDRTGVVWESTEQRRSSALENDLYMLATGRFEASDVASLDTFLDHLGSRIVFLIDWNRMRKRLRAFVGKSEAISVLKWAADHDFGHRALIEVGGELTLAEAVEYAVGPQLRYGQRLDDLISSERACAFLKDALRIASVGLRQRRSRRNIKDEIKAQLTGSFERERLAIFDLAAQQAAIAFDLASALVDALARLEVQPEGGWNAKLPERAVAWEAKADQVLNEARDDVRRFGRPRSLQSFLEASDDAVDQLEEAVALLDLAVVIEPVAGAMDKLREFAELPLRGAQELVKAVESAACITRSDVRDDLDEFMAALERLIEIEHAADNLERVLRGWLFREPIDVRKALVLREFCKAIEQSTDAQAHAAQSLRSYLMEEVLA